MQSDLSSQKWSSLVPVGENLISVLDWAGIFHMEFTKGILVIHLKESIELNLCKLCKKGKISLNLNKHNEQVIENLKSVKEIR